VSVPSSGHTDSFISHFVFWTSLSPLSCYNALHEPKICKLRADGTTRDITLTIPETPDIIRKPGKATSQCIIIVANNTGFFNIYGIKKHKKEITCNILGQ